jgi:hypothetical protein
MYPSAQIRTMRKECRSPSPREHCEVSRPLAVGYQKVIDKYIKVRR